MRTPWLMFGVLFLSGCERSDPKLDAASKAIQESAEKCLISVRDSKTKYDDTPACNALSALSMSYLEARGGAKDPPLKYAIRFESAQRMAWTARAMSDSCSGRPPRIW